MSIVGGQGWDRGCGLEGLRGQSRLREPGGEGQLRAVTFLEERSRQFRGMWLNSKDVPKPGCEWVHIEGF